MKDESYRLDSAVDADDDPPETREGQVAEALHGERLDKVVVGMAPEFSRSHLQHLIERHVAETGSAWGAEILRDFRTYVARFWLVKPKAASLESLIENLSRAA